MEHTNSPRTLTACFDGANAYIKVSGRATFQAGQPLRDFVGRMPTRHANRLLVDATECESMDSTFIGVLTSAAMDGRARGISVEIANASDRVIQQIAGLGLSAFFRFSQGSETVVPAEALSLLPVTREAGADVTARVILEAHEKLAVANPDNQGRFQDVIEGLRRETGAAGS
jgi:anti-anti-sigma factor